MNLLRHISTWFWNEKVWLPPNTTWADRVSTPQNQLPNFNDLWTYPFVVALFLLVLRYLVLNPFVFSPIANYFGVKNVRSKNVEPHVVLESTYNRHSKKVPSKAIETVAKSLGWTERKVERWLRARSAMDRINTHTKFTECLWQLLYYSIAFVYGFYVLHDKIWIYDLRELWSGYPYTKLYNDLWIYYMMSTGFYWAGVITHCAETRRKDFYQMLVHHLVTLALLAFSFTCNFTRIGALVLFVHDIADIPLHLTKLCVYAKFKSLTDVVFIIFTVCWIATRCIYYPWYLVHHAVTYPTTVIPFHPVYYIFVTLLTSLAVLHYYWTYFIMRMVVNTILKGDTSDTRSSSDDDGKEEPKQE